jgi:hypothetical protein
MSANLSSTFLHRVLALDAVASGVTAILLIAAADLIDDLLGLPAALMRGAGLVLVPYVAYVALAATRRVLSPPLVWTIIAANILWAAASGVLLLSGLVAPTALGMAFVLAQAVVVALLGELQYVGLRQPEAQTYGT